MNINLHLHKSNWSGAIHDFGKLLPKQKVKAVFKYSGQGTIHLNKNNGQDIISGCWCTGASYNVNTKELDINYTVQELPKQVLASGVHHRLETKTITVRFNEVINGKQEIINYVFTLTGIIYANKFYLNQES